MPLPFFPCIHSFMFHICMSFILLFGLLLGSAILPPSCIPERNPRTPYVVCIYLSFVSDWFPPCIRTSPLRTIYHILTSVHSLISHPSHFPLIFPSVRLCYLDFLRTFMFHPYLLCSTRVVFKISSLYSVSSESTLLFSASFCLSLLNLPFLSHL